jgi:alpha-glucosidase
MIALRRRTPALSVGGYGIIESRGEVLVYERLWGDQRVTVFLNFAATTVYTPLARGTVLLSTSVERTGESVSNLLCLRPNEGLVLETPQQAEGDESP